jgi:hypothetical protein
MNTFVSFQCGNLLWCDHQTYSPGQLQIQRGADVLLCNANARVNNQSQHKAALGNLVLCDDAGEGVQTYRWDMGYWYGSPGCRITDYQVADDGSYVYACGDYAAAYSDQQAPGQGGSVAELTRQVVFLRPNIVVVYDRVEMKKAVYPFRLQWHFLPTANLQFVGDAYTSAIGASQLRGQTFSADPLTTKMVGVSQGVAQVGITLATPAAKARFLTVFQAAAVGETFPPTAYKGEDWESVAVAGWAVQFARAGSPAMTVSKVPSGVWEAVALGGWAFKFTRDGTPAVSIARAA